MSSTHKKNTQEDKAGDADAGESGEHKRKRGRSVAITCSLPANIDDDDADVLRKDLAEHVEAFLKKRLGKNLQDLIVH